MKLSRKIVLMVFVLVGNLIGNELNAAELTADTLMRPDRNQLGVQLLQLRDSMDITLKKVEKNLGKNAPIVNQQLDKDFKELTLSRIEIEKAIAKLATTTENSWNVDVQSSLINTLNDKRNDYRRILNDIEQVLVAKNYRS